MKWFLQMDLKVYFGIWMEWHLGFLWIACFDIGADSNWLSIWSDYFHDGENPLNSYIVMR